MDDPNDPMRLPLPPSRPTSLLPTTSISAENSPESDSEAGFGAAGERPREREPSPDGRAPRSPAEHDTIDGAKLPPTISGIGDGLTPPRPETTIDGTIYADVGVQAVDKPSVVVTADVADDAEEQERKAEEAAEFKRVCPWEETVEKRYPAPNPEFFTEFEKKYPPDAHGEEASPNARVWRVYRDRVTELDDDLLEGWHKTLDVLLIFVGLFSAIATAFIIEAYKGLQPDYGEITARGVVALLSQVNSSFAAPLPIPSIDQVDASSRTLWINALWFASLTLALIDALLCILVKQWLVEYASKQRQPAASGRTWAWRHYAFRQGLDKWGIGVFISSLSVILYGALYLFLFGLLVFLFDLDRRLCVVSMGLTMLIGSLHLVSVFLPLWFGDCPTTTPVLTHLRWIGAFCKHAVMRIWVYSITAASLPARWFSESAWDPVPASASPASTTVLSPAAYDGSRIIEGREPLRDALVISWMLSNLPADNDVLIAIGAVGSLDRERHDKYDWSAENPLRSDFVGPIAERRLRDLLRPGGHRDQIMRHLQQSSVMRALLLLQWKSRDEVFLVSLGSLFDVAVHDVSILSNILLQVVYFDDPRDRFFHTTHTRQN
ncbi:hypothetical protein BKA62DRAFT_775475 [Auriculariales sp. MPI-PUGE-AT-0066]|nr:hypothetical protein BKA62DRAFT_775475 [Auriculariales sp. MPI-PUGE-AT-0066]